MSGGGGLRNSGWSTFASVITAVAALLAAMAALFGSHEAKEYVDYLKARNRDVYLAGEDWKTSRSWSGDWKRAMFNDSAWLPAVSPAPSRQNLPTGAASYATMWSPDGVLPGVVYFRRTIEFPDRDRVQRVTILSAADDDHRIFLNGTAVVSDVDRRAGPALFTDVTPFVQTGPNVFAVEAVNESLGCWLVLNIEIQRR